MSRLKKTLQSNKKLLSIYFTAGYPKLEDTVPVIQQLEESGVDLIEIGLPFSDPLADGPTIQQSSTQALNNGMSTDVLFDQLKDVRENITIPLVIMGYFNPVLQYGVEAFLQQCKKIGIDALILPDLPFDVFESEYKYLFNKYDIEFIFLVTPQTKKERIHEIDKASNSFIYMVSSASTTGSKSNFSEEQKAYFKTGETLQLKNPTLVGFGIHNNETFIQATENNQGAIIGSAFIKFLKDNEITAVPQFIDTIRNKG